MIRQSWPADKRHFSFILDNNVLYCVLFQLTNIYVYYDTTYIKKRTTITHKLIQGIFMPSALVIHGVPIECINQAAVTYFVPAKIIIAVLATERGKVGMAKPNSNGT